MRWVSYTRAASCLDEEVPADIISIQNQIIADFMKANGWTVEKKYSDRKNNKEEVRAFDQMVQDGMQRNFDGIVVCSVFRCGKNFFQAKEILADTFFPAGIQFAVAEDQFCSIGKTKKEIEDYFHDRRGKLNGKLMTDFANQHVKEGRIPFQLRKYGYVFSEDGRSMTIEAEGASVVRLIFRQFLNGEAYSEIARELNEKGVTAPMEQKALAVGKQANVISSAKWRSNAVKQILGSSIYTGKTSCIVDGMETEYEVPAIISEEIFEATQKKMREIRESRKKQKPVETPGVSLLYKRIYDKNTGLTMSSVKNPMAPEERGYLPGSHNRCSRKMRDILVPEKNVIDAILYRLQTAEAQAQYIDQILNTDLGKHQAEVELSPYRDRAKQAVSEMNQLCLERMNVHYDYQSGGMSGDEFQKMEDSYQDQFWEYEGEFQKIKASVRIIEKTYSSVNPWLVLYRNVPVPSELDHDFIKKWIDRVLVEDAENIEVVLKEEEWMNRLPQEWLLHEQGKG